MKSILVCTIALIVAGVIAGGSVLQAAPVFTALTELKAADGEAEDEFGRSVAISGDTVVIGAWRDDVGANIEQGSAYVYVFNGTSWNFQQKLTASDGVASADFGNAVSIQGNTIVVGASTTKIGTNVQQGKVYVFTRSGTQWTQTQALTASDGDRLDHFGSDVSLDGNTLLIGAGEDTVAGKFSQGSAYVFVKNGATWTQQQKLIGPDSLADNFFGDSVSVSGDWLMIGARNHKVGSEVAQGAAYAYQKVGNTWTFKQKLLASNASGFQRFGFDVCVKEDTAIVSKETGSSHIFVKTGSTWAEQAMLNPADYEGSNRFGISVSLEGDRAVVGSRSKVGANSSQGAIYVFERTGTQWAQKEKLIVPSGKSNDYFGHSVGLSGGTIIGGAPLVYEGTKYSQGAAYVFQDPSAMLAPIDLVISLNPSTNQLTLTWNANPGRLYAVKSSSDLNGFPTTIRAAFVPAGPMASHTFAKPAAAKMFYRVEDVGAAP